MNHYYFTFVKQGSCAGLLVAAESEKMAREFLAELVTEPARWRLDGCLDE